MSHNLRVLSIRQPWCYLIFKGDKKIENRKNKLIDSWTGVCVLVHASKTQYSPTKRRKYHGMIKRYYKHYPEWQEQYGRFEDFDAEMQKTAGKILGVVRFDKSDEQDSSSYPWYNVPVPTTHHWKIGARHKFAEPVDGHRGNVGWRRVCDDLNKQIMEEHFQNDALYMNSIMGCYNESDDESYNDTVCLPLPVSVTTVCPQSDSRRIEHCSSSD